MRTTVNVGGNRMISTLHYSVGLNLFGRMPAPRPPWSNEFDPTLFRRAEFIRPHASTSAAVVE
ncbi:MAG: hypothetical protein ACI9MF_001193 [Gammaproteobacteria bacterium]|jgi:hypothetical protein